MTRTLRRRRLLVAGSALLAGMAGCLESFETDDELDADSAGTDDAGADDGNGESIADESDLEADAVLLTVERDGDELDAVTVGAVASAGSYSYDDVQGVHYVPIELTEDGTSSFVDALEAVDAFEDPQSTEIHTYFQDERIDSHTLGPNLAAAMESGEFDGEFRMIFPDEETAQTVADELSVS